MLELWTQTDERTGLELADKGQEVFDETILADAFTVARQARFEFGETPHGLPPVDREGV